MNELYNMLCQHGSKCRTSKEKDEIIIDVGHSFVALKYVADSVAPGKELVNVVADIAIHIINIENNNPKKVIMPLRVSVSFIFGKLFQTFSVPPRNGTGTKKLPSLSFLAALTCTFLCPKTQCYLLDCRFDVKELQRYFTFDANNRLDHKDLVSIVINYSFFAVNTTY